MPNDVARPRPPEDRAARRNYLILILSTTILAIALVVAFIVLVD